MQKVFSKIFKFTDVLLEKEEELTYDKKYFIKEEEFVKEYFISKGFEIKRCSFNKKNQNVDFLSHLLFSESARQKVMESLITPGVPDFIIWDKIEFMFVEVKKWNDGLRANQIEWFYKFKDLPSRIMLVRIIW